MLHEFKLLKIIQISKSWINILSLPNITFESFYEQKISLKCSIWQISQITHKKDQKILFAQKPPNLKAAIFKITKHVCNTQTFMNFQQYYELNMLQISVKN